MRVVVWNMAHKVASWAALEKLAAHIAHLNEARVQDQGNRSPSLAFVAKRSPRIQVHA